MLEKRKFYINGEWVDPLEGRDLEVIDPSNEEPFAIQGTGRRSGAGHEPGNGGADRLVTLGAGGGRQLASAGVHRCAEGFHFRV